MFDADEAFERWWWRWVCDGLVRLEAEGEAVAALPDVSYD